MSSKFIEIHFSKQNKKIYEKGKCFDKIYYLLQGEVEIYN